MLGCNNTDDSGILERKTRCFPNAIKQNDRPNDLGSPPALPIEEKFRQTIVDPLKAFDC